MSLHFKNPEVAAIFEAYPKNLRSPLLTLRQLIFDIASKTKGVGDLEETLRWNQPSYLTSQSKSGSIIRIDQMKGTNQYAIYFHCQTSLISTFREIYPQLRYQGNRAIVFDESEKIPVKELEHCILMALTYNLGRRGS
ncbi:DUF1801 domain-containing protein [Candidatus Peregrinibacteria bacterium]|nr:MAG: DUF1801 domain-containing protein [Candidatus Peregrinibacteria bacterium]